MIRVPGKKCTRKRVCKAFGLIYDMIYAKTSKFLAQSLLVAEIG